MKGKQEVEFREVISQYFDKMDEEILRTVILYFDQICIGLPENFRATILSVLIKSK